jgi:hypothetical protein
MSENTESSNPFDLTAEPNTEPVNSTEPNGADPVDEDTTESDVKTETVDVDYFYATKLDPARQISPTGVYLDDVQRRDAEKVRALIEDREPDLENPPASQSTPLFPREHFNHSLNSLVIGDNEPDVTLPTVQVVK